MHCATTASERSDGSPSPGQIVIGVLAVQGDVSEHLDALRASGVEATPVRRPSEIDELDGLVLPGGESTTIIRLLETFDLLTPLRNAIASGLPTYGSCAGMILLADRLLDGHPGQRTIGGMNVTVRRNAFGRQVDSFEGPVQMQGIGSPLHGVFIRAPWVEDAGEDVEILATIPDGPARGRAVAVRQGNLLATSFHPEVGSDLRVHQLFANLVRAHKQALDARGKAGRR